jgi:vacuolar-type H+-ATPase subunit F/Vma7
MTEIVQVLCRPAVAAGFGLAGITADTVADDGDALAALGPLLARPGVGVVLIEEAIYDGLSPEIRGRLDRSARPIVIPFPGPSWTAPPSAEERVVELLRRAIGYRVKLQ